MEQQYLTPEQAEAISNEAYVKIMAVCEEYSVALQPRRIEYYNGANVVVRYEVHVVPRLPVKEEES